MTRRSVPWLILVANITIFAAGVALALLYGVGDWVGEYVWSAGFLSLAMAGALIAWKRPANPVGWLLVIAPLFEQLATTSETYADIAMVIRPGALPLATVVNVVHEILWIPSFLGILVFAMLLFPTGTLLSPRWRWVAGTAIVGGAINAVVWAVGYWPVRHVPVATVDDPIAILEPAFLRSMILVAFPLMMVGVLGALTSLVVRFHRSQGDERAQMKWMTYAMALTVGLIAAGAVFEKTLAAESALNRAGESIGLLLIPTIAAALAISVLKYRLYDIDIVISKTLVFAGLAGFITAIYVGIVVGIGTLLGSGDEPNLALSIVATAVVAVAFQPVRERLTRLANRLVFGKRATPYEVLSRFSEQLADTAAPEATLERVARLLVDGTGAARAQIWLDVAGQLRPAVTWPTHMTDDTDPAHLVEVTLEGEKLGALSIDKQRGEQLTPTDAKLVDDLAAQAGLVLRNLRLTEQLRAKIVDLQASRQRLVAAQDAERRRLERDLHDGAQRQLLELKSQLTTASSTAAGEQAEKAAQILEQVAADADDAVATLRELAHGIYPPLLAAEGLAGALTAQAAKAAVPVVVEANGVGRYSQDVEAAVYFCVLEAIQNAAKYAEPSQVIVRLAQGDGHLTFEVSDDGAGFDPATTTKGAGTTNMTDRLDALTGQLKIESRPGTGTTLTGVLPAETIGANA